MGKINLRDFYGKTVKMQFKDGNELIGFVSGIDDAESNENGLESMTITGTSIAKYVDVNEEELDSIEIVD